MASTRRPPPLQVYQDPNASLSSNSDHDVEAALLHALGPLADATNNHPQLLPPNHPPLASAPSPTKQHSSPPRPISASGLKDITLPLPAPPLFTTDSLQKNPTPAMGLYPPPAQQQGKPLFAHYASAPHMDQENYYDPSTFPNFHPMPYTDVDASRMAPLKRARPDPQPLNDKSNKKVKLEKDEPFDLPDPKDMPSVHDDGTKPAHSYAELIGMAILRAPNRRLTLAQIYKWISDNFSFYKSSESGWQNSIRHNLSLNRNFIKQERPKDDPGKGNYWAIKPGEERPYLLGKKNPIRRITNPDGSQYLHGLPPEMGGFRPATAPSIGHFTLAPNPNPVRKAETKNVDAAKYPDDGDLDSDGTIPASDPALQDDDRDNDAAAMPPPPSHLRSSPPPVDITSSPPQMTSQRRRTPPPAPRFPSTSRSGNRRQKFAGPNDSGYWSSIESSVARNGTHQLTSEADVLRPRIKKGRAEAEIARMRSSSIDSPIMERPKLSTSRYASSSPVREEHPLTPAVVFKRPAKPPPSVSPNTNLRNHRDRMKALLGTPAKLLGPVEAEATNWSPAFHLGDDGTVGLTPYVSPFKTNKTPWKAFNETPSNGGLFHAAFDVFIDAPEDDAAARGSPEKRSARRPSLVRAATSAGILADITGSGRSNSITLAPPSDSPFSMSPFLTKPSFLRSPARLSSPLKQCHPAPTSASNIDLKWLDEPLDAENMHPTLNPTSVDDDAADLFGVQLPSDGSEEGIDIFQDFGKIGQAPQFLPVPNRADGSPVRRNMGPPSRPRPGLQRNHTSRW